MLRSRLHLDAPLRAAEAYRLRLALLPGPAPAHVVLQGVVYGSAIPTYHFSYHLEPQPDGSYRAQIRVGQERVPDDFRMIVPILLDFGDKGTAMVRVEVAGPLTELTLPILPMKPEKVEFNPFQAELAETKTEGWKGG